MHVNRKTAIATGSPRYYGGAPCKFGHTAGRYTKGGSCVVCANARQRAREKTPVSADAAARYNEKWNASTKGYAAKLRWKLRDPINAWACSATGGAKSRAAKASLPFDLTKEYVRGICTERCPVFDVPFVWHGQKLGPWSPSLDRIVPEKGYVRGNVVVICTRANMIKSDASVEEIKTVAAWLQNVLAQ